jgi:hypothetical protein
MQSSLPPNDRNSQKKCCADCLPRQSNFRQSISTTTRARDCFKRSCGCRNTIRREPSWEFFRIRQHEILKAFTAVQSDGGTDPQSLDLIELGAGDGTKTAVLIEHFLKQGIDFTYSPIDISQEANDALSAKFRDKFPELRISPHTGDYFKVLGSLKNGSGRRKILMFLGSNIGNFHEIKPSIFSTSFAVSESERSSVHRIRHAEGSAA